MSKSNTNLHILESYGQMPLYFEINHGQADEQVRFLTRGKGHSLLLKDSEVTLVLQTPTLESKSISLRVVSRTQRVKNTPESQTGLPQPILLHIRLAGSNPRPEVTGLDKLTGKTNYFIGNDPEAWHTDISTYAKVKYENVYPGIDLVYYGQNELLEHDFIVQAGADPHIIEMEFIKAKALSLDEEGNLLIDVGPGRVQLKRPVIYQKQNGLRQEVGGSYVLKGLYQVGFAITDYDVSKPLIIDPVLVYSTYFGGADFDEGNDIAVDSMGNAYITGLTGSINFKTQDAYQSNYQGGSSDAFVFKLDTNGGLIYSTFLGGSDWDSGNGIDVDFFGYAYITGYTNSNDFPTRMPYQSSLKGLSDAFITKLNPQGNGLVYSTYLGGSKLDNGNAITVDLAGNAYVTGRTESADFPTVNSLQPFVGIEDAFISKINASGLTLDYSTFLGGEGYGSTGSGSNYGNGIAVDVNGNAYVTGFSSSDLFPVVNAYQPEYGGGSSDAFVAKIGASETIADLAITKTGLPNPLTVGDTLTYVITVTNGGPATATGVIMVDTLPVNVTFVLESHSQGSVNLTGNMLTWIIGALVNGAQASITITVIPNSMGTISNTATVTGNEYDPTPDDNTVTRINQVTPVIAESDLAISKSASADPVMVGETLTYTVIVSNKGPAIATGVVMVETLPVSFTFIFATASQGTCNITYNVLICNLGNLAVNAQATIQITVEPQTSGVFTNTAETSSNEYDPNPDDNIVRLPTLVFGSIFIPEDIIVEKVYASCQQRECFSSFTVYLSPSGESHTLVSLIFANGLIVPGSIIITPIPERSSFSRAQFIIQIPFILIVQDATGATITITGNLPDIVKDVILYYPSSHPEFKLELRIETRSELLTNPVFSTNSVQLAIGVYVVVKVTGLVQLVVPAFGFCPEPVECEQFLNRKLDPNERGLNFIRLRKIGFFEVPK